MSTYTTQPFAFVKKFPSHGAYTLSLAPIAGGKAKTVTRQLFIKSGNIKTPLASSLNLDGKDTPYLLVAGGWKGEKTYYVYVKVADRFCFVPLSGEEYHSFKASAVTLTRVPVATPETLAEPVVEPVAEPVAEPVVEPEATETPAPTKSKRAQRRGQKAVA